MRKESLRIFNRSNVLDHIIVLPLLIALEAREEAELPPFLGSTLRGAMGTALRDMICLNASCNDCASCKSSSECPYTKLFYYLGENSMNYKNMPGPFVIYPVGNAGPVYKPGDILKFRFLLFGEYAMSNYRIYIRAINDMCETGLGSSRKSFMLRHVGQSGWNRLRPESDRPASYDYEVIERQKLPFPGIETDRIALAFDTPLKIRFEGQNLERLTFAVFMRNVFRRLSIISEHYYGKKLDIDFNSMLEAADTVKTTAYGMKDKTFKRYSNRLQGSMSLEGLTGTIEFCGDLSPFVPFIEACRITHVGKNTSMGFGHYKTIYEFV